MLKSSHKLCLSALLITITASNSFAKEAKRSYKNILIDNALEQCVAIKSYSLQSVQNITLLNLKYHRKQAIGHCGCKSALAQYRAFKSHQKLAAGLIDFRDKDSLSLTLTHVDSLLSEDSITVSFSCSQPQ